MYDFFVSHSTPDVVDIVEPIVSDFIKTGSQVWYDKSELLTGDNITEKIKEGLDQSLCLIIILTHNFMSNSKWGYFEVGNFLAVQKRRIIPIMYDLTDLEKIEFTRMFGNLKYIDASISSLDDIVLQCKKILSTAKIENENFINKNKLKDLQKKLNSYENINAGLISIKLKEYCDVLEDHPTLAILCAKHLLASVVCDIAKHWSLIEELDVQDWRTQQDIVHTCNSLSEIIKEHIMFIYKADERRTTDEYLKLITFSIISIMTWYINTRYSLTVNLKNIEVAYPTDLRYQDFEDMYFIDKLVLREDLIAEVDTTFEWYKYNIYSHIALRDSITSKIIGYFSMLPITEDTYNKILSGDFKDKDFNTDNILQYDFPDFYKLYIASVAIHPDYQNTTAFTKLYSALVDLLLNLAKEREVFISEIVAEASTKQGEKLCKMVGMKKRVNTLFETDIYSLVLIPPEFRIKNHRGKELLELCQRKYEEYRDYFE